MNYYDARQIESVFANFIELRKTIVRYGLRTWTILY